MPDISPTYQNPHLKSAGVLPYAVNPSDNKTYVLLSQHDDSGHDCDTDKWEAFGGFQQELTLMEAAFVETWEESRQLIHLSPDNVDWNRLIVFEHYQNKYLQLMLPIAFDPKLPEEFQKRHFDDFHLMEKRKITWVLLEDLISAVQSAGISEDAKPCACISIGDEKLPLRPAFIETMASLLAAAPGVCEQVANQSLCLDSPLVISSV